MKLVVGLGNPGKKYESTRHNVGFEVIQSLAKRHGASAGKSKFEGLLQECQIRGERTLLLMPLTFMNLSGRSVRQALDFYKLGLDDLVLVCDDFNLSLGSLRFRPEGSAGGQKGLADTIQQLASDQFARLRFGIGPVPEKWDPVDFVLGRFSTDESVLVELQINRACDAVETWIADGIDQAMNRYNGDQQFG
ncbi:MAG: aminoacyl-tRNA hydrolase [Planctomycetales bacterium]|nr:aminoacyl-tRNA hydrolase [Planctomycetales bacterium]